jgi:D-alanine-D-alanine ligase
MVTKKQAATRKAHGASHKAKSTKPRSQTARRRTQSARAPAAIRKVRVGVVFGGKSGEHEISLLSAQSVMHAMDKDKYEIVPIGITQEGRWLSGGDPLKALTGGQMTMPKLLRAPVVSHSSSAVNRALIPGGGQSSAPPVDVIFPVLHGPMGEDGTVQGLFELADIPYVGAGVMSSAVGMDKAVMKDVFRAHGLPVAPYLVFLRGDWERDPAAVMARIETQLGFPCFVKPANLGSSVGITKVHSLAELDAALAEAASFDRKLLVEWAVPQAREIECSVLGNDDPIASVPGEIKPGREFYDYEAKYFDEHTQLIVPAPILDELTARVRELAIRAFCVMDCAGMARVDFLLSGETSKLYVSEINTIPGFTAVSMYPKLWEASGLSYPELIDRLIELALERHRDKKRSRTTRVVDEDQ